MAGNPEPPLGINSWLEEELREQYSHDRGSVDESWKHLFEQNGAKTINGASRAVTVVPRNGSAATGKTAYQAGANEELTPLRGAAARLAENMAASVYVPLATSQRTIPVKVVDENRRLINHHRSLAGKGKVSYTHLIGWAIVKSVQANPGLNHAFAENGGEPVRVVHPEINLGIAVDVAAKDGARGLLVPNVKNAAGMAFAQYAASFDDLVTRARGGKLVPGDFQGTTISLTNPGTVGTMASI
ncbi:MAG: 2-oxo acid dehydrogenase subunit E2, partial [Acidobacteriota bacterium]|nr:2-oxo acid dehydrogenase subunit E2 [Acidobacteriota bacterium]